MFANIDYNHPAVKKEMITWGEWLAEALQCDGFRLDAIKHISHEFLGEFLTQIKQERGDEFYIVGEFWNAQLATCEKFLEDVDYKIDLFDVPLHFNLEAASHAGRDFDLRTIFDNTLVKIHPFNTVTFVDNHDSQPHGSLESWVEDGFKQTAYALILLRQEGYPCLFYGDYFGIGGEEPIIGKKESIDPLLYARYHKAYGEQDDYFDHANTIGWVRRGIPDIKHSGCAVVIANGDEGEKRMFVGENRSGEIWVDLTKTREEQISIEEDGFATFPVNGASVSVWAFPEVDVE